MLQTVMHVGSVEAIVSFCYNGQHWTATAGAVYADIAEEWDADFNSLVMQRFSSTLAADATVEELCDALLAQISIYEQELSSLIVFEELAA